MYCYLYCCRCLFSDLLLDLWLSCFGGDCLWYKNYIIISIFLFYKQFQYDDKTAYSMKILKYLFYSRVSGWISITRWYFVQTHWRDIEKCQSISKDYTVQDGLIWHWIWRTKFERLKLMLMNLKPFHMISILNFINFI